MDIDKAAKKVLDDLLISIDKNIERDIDKTQVTLSVGISTLVTMTALHFHTSESREEFIDSLSRIMKATMDIFTEEKRDYMADVLSKLNES